MPPRIGEHNVALANTFREALDLHPAHSAIASVPLAPSAMDRLRNAGIRFTVMDGRARLSFHLFTTEQDVAAAVTAVRG